MRRFLLLGILLSLGSKSFAELPLLVPEIQAKSYYLWEVESQQGLAGLAADQPIAPASLTKLMTLYLVFKALQDNLLSPDQKIPVSHHAWKAEGSKLFIEPDKEVTVDQLVHGIVIDSGNDASIALAEFLAGSEDRFVIQMNKQAQSLGMMHTHYANATGLPMENHVSTAHDLALLAHALITRFPMYYPLFGEKVYTYNNITQHNRNQLLEIDSTVDGMKTGHTEEAGYCLVASAKRGPRRLVAVVLGSSSALARSSETLKLINWGFQAFDSQRVFQGGQGVRSVPIYKGAFTQLEGSFAQDIWVTFPRTEPQRVREVLTVPQPLVAPVSEGQKIGQLDVLFDQRPVTHYPLLAHQSVPLGNEFTQIWDTVRLMLK
ncbi:MAG: D-alanyl-D-alanine carboxypeptidase [Ferrovum sp.]|jgi:D-alanyl-D-alanine carboxypeptidase (penicillin-binding protein 5/6)|nr:D-alanyl-D-alanine carboxypeptidase [Ferrovum sp.]